ncbi:hypothetical protein D3C87_643740 [compost metagenome]
MIALEGYTQRSTVLAASPEEVARYFSGNELLLKQLVGADRVERLAHQRYLVSVGRFEALGLVIDPHFEVEFTDHPGLTRMESTSCRVVTSESLDFELAAGFSGEARFDAHPDGCLLTSWSAARVDLLRLPGLLRTIPAAMIQSVGNAVIHKALDATSARFVPLIREDFERWRSRSVPC